MDFHPYKRACWQYAHQLLEDELAPHSELVQRIGATFVMESDCTGFGKLLYAVYEAGRKKAFESYQEHLAKQGLRLEVRPDPIIAENQASDQKGCNPGESRPSRAGSGRHATNAYRRARR